MSQYILRRVLIAFPLILVVVTIVFVMTRASPGDPAQVMAGDRAGPELVEKIRRDLGLDRPVFEQYLIFLRNLAQGDLGRSVKFREPITERIAKSIPFTAALALLSVTIGTALGLAIGIITAVYQRSWPDRLGIVTLRFLLFHPDLCAGTAADFNFLDSLARSAGAGGGDLEAFCAAGGQLGRRAERADRPADAVEHDRSP